VRRTARGHHRRRQLRGSGRGLLQRLRRASIDAGARGFTGQVDVAIDKIEVFTRTQAIAAEGENGRLARLRLRGPDGDERTIDADACFIFIGALPRTDWLDGVVARDAHGFILAGPEARAHGWPLSREPYTLETSVPGVFVAGDVRARSIKRVASAVGEGSMAVSLIHEYLAGA